MVDAAWVRRLPKAELHLHIEGTLEPELMFELARRNGLALRFKSVDDLRRAYQFKDLQSFLDIYYEGAAVLRTRRDFEDLAWAYCVRAAADGVRHAEVFFDPQSHTARGVPIGDVIEGLSAALARAEKELKLTSRLIMCFLRHLHEDDALATLDAAGPFLKRLTAVGLDSSEKGHPPSKFKKVFRKAKDAGLRAVAHAGEEGPPEYVWEALDVLGVERVDHGVRCLEDEALVKRLAKDRVPLTVCPLSNVKLRVYQKLEDHRLKELLERGLAACVNSDDPAYFGGYVLDNYLAVERALGLSQAQVAQLARHSLEASFLPADEKKKLLTELESCCSVS